MRELQFIVHDLKHPITAIKLKAELALRHLDRAPGATVADNLHGIIRAASAMNARVLELLEQRAVEHHSPVTPRELVLTTVDLLDKLAEERRIALRVRVPESLPVLLADKHEALPVILNLVGNAIDHGREGGTVEVSAKQRAADILFCVHDDGAGIPEAAIQDLFTVGRRGPTSQGHGLGLAIVARRLAELGGNIWVESSPAMGTSFFVTLPASKKNRACACSHG